MRRADGDLIVLGVAGKMGPTLARMARRAIGRGRCDAPRHRRVALLVAGRSSGRCRRTASRRSAAICSTKPRSRGCPTRRTSSSWPAGSSARPGNESLTWAMNTHLPAVVCARYRGSRIVAFSTGNVYGLTPAWPRRLARRRSARARRRVRHELPRPRTHVRALQRHGGIPVAILRLNYATEMRYGVLVDLARRVSRRRARRPRDGLLQRHLAGRRERHGAGGADARVVAAVVVNIAGPEELSVRDAATELARLLATDVTFTGTRGGRRAAQQRRRVAGRCSAQPARRPRHG